MGGQRRAVSGAACSATGPSSHAGQLGSVTGGGVGGTPLVEGNDGAEELAVRGAAAGAATGSAVRVQLVTRAANTARAPRARPGTNPS